MTIGLTQKLKLKFFNLWGSVEWGGGEGLLPVSIHQDGV